MSYALDATPEGIEEAEQHIAQLEKDLRKYNALDDYENIDETKKELEYWQTTLDMIQDIMIREEEEGRGIYRDD